jgi:pyruvate/2-oxoglutarate dehydrogenase complex dihydrolipoamide acyltransferase (E2) component
MNDGVDPDGTPAPETPDTPDLITMGYGRQRRRRLPNPAALASVAIVALAGGAGVGYAATHSSGPKAADTAAVGVSGADAAASPTASASAPSPSAPAPSWREMPGGKRWFAFGGFLGGIGPMAGGVVHGQVVVPKSGGGYQTLDLQRGQVTAVSSTSVTVKSSDGYTASYAVTGSTIVDAKAAGIGSVKTGDTVVITATVSGSTATAASIMDQTAISSGRVSFGFPAEPGAPANPPS